MVFNSIEEIIADVRVGKMVIIVDDEQRENEGDLLIAASHITPENINFMITKPLHYSIFFVCSQLSM